MPARIATKTKVIRFKTENPFMRTSEIAKRMGYSRQYVNRVLQQHGIVTRIPSGFKSRHVYCLQCKEVVMTIRRKNRYNEKKAKKTFCSKACKTTYYNIELNCSYKDCPREGKPFIKERSKVIQAYNLGSKKIYCGKLCETKDKKFKD
tara:strand:- start:3356 stop:3799 length:444 start_codon:yes stop_codon:yes gene_type:complete